MPHEVIGEAIAQVVEAAAEVAVDGIDRKFGWKGCLALTLSVVAIGAAIYFVIR